ncbi:mRNA-decapping enzyme [Emydomyces testavorans]|uniref:mRNA-decapping enzyme n=1 Tax=Emydomyces testavorans TaxID=2070801 RepID=A0AAF0DFV3_9EURO|nr:mRNA-decapping enzyme [Emydomyces testavorans]
MPSSSILLSLPAELQNLIIDEICPGDIPSLSATCKHLHDLVAPRLAEHKRFLAYQGRFKVGRSNIHQHGLDSQPTLELLAFIAARPRLSWYVRDLTSCYRPPALFEKEDELLQALHNLDSINQLVRTCRFIQERERGHWIESIRDGKGGALLALLLGQLHGSKHLQIPSDYQDPISPFIAQIIARCASRSYGGYLDQPLSSLESVNISVASGRPRPRFPCVGNEDEHQQNVLILFWTLTFLPNIKHLSLKNYYTHDIFEQEEMFDTALDVLNIGAFDPTCRIVNKPYRLKSIELRSCRMLPRSLSFVLRNCKGLESLKYFMSFEHRTPLYDPSRYNERLPTVIEILYSHASSSLKTLAIASEPESWLEEQVQYRSVPSQEEADELRAAMEYWQTHEIVQPDRFWTLKDFPVLTHLMVDVDVMYGDSYKPAPLSTVLPMSIEQVDILAFSTTPDQYSFEISSLLSFNPLDFPHLQSLYIWHMAHFTTMPTDPRHIELMSEHSIPFFKSILLEAGFEENKISQYHLGAEYFEKRRPKTSTDFEGLWPLDRQMRDIPSADAVDHFVIGVYYEFGHWADYSITFDGLRARIS